MGDDHRQALPEEEYMFHNSRRVDLKPDLSSDY